MAEEKASKTSRETWANYILKTIDRLVCIFKGTLLYCFPSKSATALTNSTSNMGTYGRYCCIYSTIKKPCRSPLQPRFQWKARGLFLESSKNVSGPKSLSNCNPLLLKSCKENQEDYEVYWLRTLKDNVTPISPGGAIHIRILGIFGLYRKIWKLWPIFVRWN